MKVHILCIIISPRKLKCCKMQIQPEIWHLTDSSAVYKNRKYKIVSWINLYRFFRISQTWFLQEACRFTNFFFNMILAVEFLPPIIFPTIMSVAPRWHFCSAVSSWRLVPPFLAWSSLTFDFFLWIIMKFSYSWLVWSCTHRRTDYDSTFFFLPSVINHFSSSPLPGPPGYYTYTYVTRTWGVDISCWPVYSLCLKLVSSL